jgi:hypothetical protein
MQNTATVAAIRKAKMTAIAMPAVAPELSFFELDPWSAGDPGVIGLLELVLELSLVPDALVVLAVFLDEALKRAAN